MNNLAALILSLGLLAGFSVHAQSASGDPSTRFNWLVFYPHARQTVVSLQYATPLNDGTSSYTGGQTSAANTSYDQITLGINYGITDRLRLSISDYGDIDHSTVTTQIATGKGNVTHTNGIPNPTLNLSYRLMDPTLDGNLGLDLVLAATPSFGPGQAGQFASGSTTSSFSVPLYWIHGANEVALVPQVTHNFGGEVDNSNPAKSTQNETYWYESIALNDRFHLNDQWYLQGNLTYQFNYDYDSNYEGTGLTDNHRKASAYFTPSIVVGYLISENFIVTGEISYSSTATAVINAASVETDNYTSQTTALIQARFLF